MVKFTRLYGPYNTGEVASFRQETERDLIKRRIAVAHTKEQSGGEKKPEEKKPEDRKPEEPKTRQTVVGPQRR